MPSPNNRNAPTAFATAALPSNPPLLAVDAAGLPVDEAPLSSRRLAATATHANGAAPGAPPPAPPPSHWNNRDEKPNNPPPAAGVAETTGADATSGATELAAGVTTGTPTTVAADGPAPAAARPETTPGRPTAVGGTATGPTLTPLAADGPGVTGAEVCATAGTGASPAAGTTADGAGAESFAAGSGTTTETGWPPRTAGIDALGATTLVLVSPAEDDTAPV